MPRKIPSNDNGLEEAELGDLVGSSAEIKKTLHPSFKASSLVRTFLRKDNASTRFLLVGLIVSAVFIVTTFNGKTSTACISSKEELQNAFDKAVDGDTIFLCRGTIHLEKEDPELTIVSPGVTLACNGSAGDCILDGGALINSGREGHILTVKTNQFACEGITFQNADVRESAAVSLYHKGNDSGSYSFIGCSFINNGLGGEGNGAAGLEVIGAGNDDESLADLIIDGCSFVGNRNVDSKEECGAALCLSNLNSVTIKSSKFHYNLATGKKGFSGAISVDGISTLTVEGCEFLGNSAPKFGGAIYVADADFVRVATSYFGKNKSKMQGGALYIEDVDEIIIQQCNFENNINSKECESSPEECSAGGGAVSIEETGKTSFSECMFKDNVSGWGGAISTFEAKTISVNFTEFDENTALGAGAVYFEKSSAVDLHRCSFTNNKGIHMGVGGGGFGMSEVNNANVNDVCFVGNEAFKGGAGLYWESKSSLDNISGSDNFAITECDDIAFHETKKCDKLQDVSDKCDKHIVYSDRG